MVWYSRLQEFSIVCCDPHSQGFDIVNKAEVDVFLELSFFFGDPTEVGNSTLPYSLHIKLQNLPPMAFPAHLPFYPKKYIST